MHLRRDNRRFAIPTNIDLTSDLGTHKVALSASYRRNIYKAYHATIISNRPRRQSICLAHRRQRNGHYLVPYMSHDGSRLLILSLWKRRTNSRALRLQTIQRLLRTTPIRRPTKHKFRRNKSKILPERKTRKQNLPNRRPPQPITNTQQQQLHPTQHPNSPRLPNHPLQYRQRLMPNTKPTPPK